MTTIFQILETPGCLLAMSILIIIVLVIMWNRFTRKPEMYYIEYNKGGETLALVNIKALSKWDAYRIAEKQIGGGNITMIAVRDSSEKHAVVYRIVYKSEEQE